MVFEARLRSHTPISQSELMPRCGEGGQLLVGNLVEAADVAAVLAAELRQPDVGALGDQHRVGHPGLVRRELLVFVRRIAEGRHLGVARRTTAIAAGPAAALSRRIELHPDGQFFLAQNLAGHQQESAPGVAEQRLPKLANERQLIAERAGRAQRRRAQQIEQAHRLGSGQRNQRARGEILRQLRGHLAVDGLFGQRPVFEQLLERLERLIAVGRPEQQQLFKRGGAVRHSAVWPASHCAGVSLPRITLWPGNCSTKASSILSRLSAPTCAPNQSSAAVITWGSNCSR